MLLGHSVSDAAEYAAGTFESRSINRLQVGQRSPVGPVLVVDTSVQIERVTAPLMGELAPWRAGASRRARSEHIREPCERQTSRAQPPRRNVNCRKPSQTP